MAVEKPINLSSYPCPITTTAAAILLLIPILRMKSNNDRPSISLRSLVLMASVHIHDSSRRGRFPNGSLLSSPAIMTSLYGPFWRLY